MEDDDIDALAAAAYEDQDVIEVAVSRIASLLSVRDEVVAERRHRPDTFPAFGSPDPEPIARRAVATLLNAGWTPPSPEQVDAAAARSAERSARLQAWMASLDDADRSRVLEHYSEHGEFPPDLQPPS